MVLKEHQHRNNSSGNAPVTVIITVWKRHYLWEQLLCVLEQTILPHAIIVLQNENHINVAKLIGEYKSEATEIFHIQSELNLKYFGRYGLAALVDTEYLLMLDDDVLPGPMWLETCLAKVDRFQSVISCSGRMIPPDDYTPEFWKGEHHRQYFIGDGLSDDEFNYCPADRYVDYGCNSYFIRTEWLRYFWGQWPANMNMGEDIHLSASLALAAGIRTMVPEQTTVMNTGNLKKRYGTDVHSSWRQDDFFDVRKEIFSFWIDKKKWRPLFW